MVAVVSVEVAETSYQMLEGLSFCDREMVKGNSANFSSEKR